MRQCIQFVFRSQLVELDSVEPTDMVLGWLREQQRATGTKEGCNEGDCGACTVLLGRLVNGEIRYSPVNACILLMAQIDGAWLLTIEDLAQGDILHPIQQALVDNNATQCGFCTPGFVMAILAGQLSGSHLSAQAQLAGNLCRCTGYGGLIKSAEAALNKDSISTSQEWRLREAAVEKILRTISEDGFSLIRDNQRVSAPRSINELLDLKSQDPSALLVAGATDVGLWFTKRLETPSHIILTRYVAELQQMSRQDDDGSISIGAGVSYADAASIILDEYNELTQWFERLGSPQVRAAGTIGGNIANGSPIGDSAPVFIALGARLKIASVKGIRAIALENFFIQYGQQDIAPDEVVLSIEIPQRTANQRLEAHKISKRYDQDISSVMAVFSARGDVHRYAFGGMAGVPALAMKTMESRNPDDLGIDFQPMNDLRASAEYRLQVSKNLLGAFLSKEERAL